MAEGRRAYAIRQEPQRLVFTTGRFEADRGSVLHSGIFNREFAALLASAVLAMLVSVALFFAMRRRVAAGLAFVLVTAVAFPAFRQFVFKERLLAAVFDRAAGVVSITAAGSLGGAASFPLDEIAQVLVEKKSLTVDNPDGADFVQRISAMHGHAIPGFGDEIVLYLLKLKLRGGVDRLLYADRDMDEVIAAHGAIAGFLGLA